jgi:hypothetical protein
MPTWRDLQDQTEVLLTDPGGRKARLFACACCRRIWDGIVNVRSRWAVELGERLADGAADPVEVEEATREAFAAIHAADLRSAGPGRGEAAAARAAAATLGEAPRAAALQAARYAVVAFTGDVRAVTAEAVQYDADVPGREAERRFQLALAHDLADNPVRMPSIERPWLAWRDGVVGRLARAIYRRHRFEDLPILADALEEAGCPSAEILDHLRGPGPHARGCWAVDLLLERPVALLPDGKSHPRAGLAG